MMDFFGITFSLLHSILFFFYIKVQKPSKIYKWQIAILPLIIDYYIKITTGNHTDIDAWILPQDWIVQYCSPNYILSSSSTCKKRDASSTLEKPSNKKVAGEVCQNFNTQGCIFKECSCEHKCLECNSKDHDIPACTKQKQ